MDLLESNVEGDLYQIGGGYAAGIGSSAVLAAGGGVGEMPGGLLRTDGRVDLSL